MATIIIKSGKEKVMFSEHEEKQIAEWNKSGWPADLEEIFKDPIFKE